MEQSHIRFIQSDDVPYIAKWMMDVPLWRTYKLTSEIIIAQLTQAIKQDDTLYVIEHELQVVGFAWLLPKGMFGRSPYLKQIGIHPGYTGRGIGSDLLRYVEGQCKAFADEIFLLTSDFNKDAHKFYERKGYQHIGTIPNYILPTVAELLFYKTI